VLERAGKDCSGGTKAEVEGGTATDPSPGKYLVGGLRERERRYQ
jgi:hypothetical protein